MVTTVDAPIWLTSLRQFLLTALCRENLTSSCRKKMIALNEYCNRYYTFDNSKVLQIFASLTGGQFATALILTRNFTQNFIKILFSNEILLGRI